MRGGRTPRSSNGRFAVPGQDARYRPEPRMTPAVPSALITNDAATLGLLAITLGAVFWTASRETGFWSKFYSYVPAILMCYLLPAIYNSVGLIDGGISGLYPMARDYLLPASLVLFCIAMDIGAILRLGPK